MGIVYVAGIALFLWLHRSQHFFYAVSRTIASFGAAQRYVFFLQVGDPTPLLRWLPRAWPGSLLNFPRGNNSNNTSGGVSHSRAKIHDSGLILIASPSVKWRRKGI
ncbi:hypothetical protein B0T26DRAFT_88343 [Lasiosphaeria miniovina]|uniref:Uncharacterized protein n=1 Tax=Lasiosphaeria miniovina TaxID=1954250 RepID=A0AA40BIP4_9PEZI|nr:uncharacterized protein B0T26DRAFT_88343 [Lasiosphaeria miniovina]KAK0734950.1 hypothetical protein B0T26DRAFT_88343 [Lasiosphaeria miniovina]